MAAVARNEIMIMGMPIGSIPDSLQRGMSSVDGMTHRTGRRRLGKTIIAWELVYNSDAARWESDAFSITGYSFLARVLSAPCQPQRCLTRTLTRC
jgi:hypothetical protein